MRTRLPAMLVLVLLCTGCGGGSTRPDPGPGPGTAPEPAFVVPPMPSFAVESGINQSPPPEWLTEVVVPRTPARPTPLTRDESDAAGRDAVTLAEGHMGRTGLGARDDVVVTHVLPDEYGARHVKMAQRLDGLPVIGGGLAFHLYPDLPPGVTDNLVRGLTLATTPTVPETAAIGAAQAHYGTRAGVTLDTTAHLAVLPRLGLVKTRSDFSRENRGDFDEVLSGALLVWEVTVQPVVPDVAAALGAQVATGPAGSDADDADTDLARRENATRAGNEEEQAAFEAFTAAIIAPGARYFYDALTGALLEVRLLVAHEEWEAETATGHSYFHGQVTLDVARWTGDGVYYLHDIVRPALIEQAVPLGTIVVDADNVATHDINEMFWIKDWNNVWGDGSILNSATSARNTARRQTPAVDVAYGVQMTWDFLENVLSRWGPAGDGTPTFACVHYDEDYTDAHYNDTSKFICFGDGNTGTKPGNYGLNTVAHELGHAFWHAVGNGTDSAEARALNEGHGDIQGGLVTLYRNTGLGVGNQVRRFPNFADWSGRVVNPKGYKEKDADDVEFIGQEYWSAALTDMPEHVGGLPFGRAMIYLADGAPSDPANTLYTTEYPDGLGGVGIARAAHIWRAAVAYFIVGTPDYADMRTAFLDAAEYLYGASSMERRAVRRAFAAIRVGSGWDDTQNPAIPYAQIFGVDLKDMTALVAAWATDDTGFRELRVDGNLNHGVYKGDLFLGYTSITRAPVGTTQYGFTIEDSDGKTTSVNRSFLKARDRNLIVNGDFEDGSAEWSSLWGDNPVSTGASRAFIGEGYMVMEGLDSAWQEVTIPPEAENVTLVFRVLVRNSTKPAEMLQAQVQNVSGGLVELLATYDHDTPQDTRNFLNKGFLRQEFDLSAYAGDTVRIAFVNLTPADTYRFVVDQVVLTYTEDVVVGQPEVEVHPWENTVQFRLPVVEGASNAEIARVDWYVDNVFVGAGPIDSTDYFGATFLSSLLPGAHWVAGRVRGLDNAILADTQAVWFAPGPFHELLVNKGFEAGAWDLTYSDPPPNVVVVENVPDVTVAFDGLRALRLGGQGDGDSTEAGQAVQMPQQMATLDFSVRVRMISEEGPPITDRLVLELWNLQTFQKIAEYPVADESDYFMQGLDEGWRNYRRKNVSIPPASVSGKHILVRLKTLENASLPTYFFVDNASLRYTQYGVQLGD